MLQNTENMLNVSITCFNSVADISNEMICVELMLQAGNQEMPG